MIISKSKYLRLCQCPKNLWIEKNKSELQPKFFQKNELYNPNKTILDFSKNLFNSYDASVFLDENKNKLDFEKMYQHTNDLLQKNIESIFKPTFKYENTFFVLDIIKKVKKGYNIYLVKPSKNLRQNFIIEMAYLSYIFEKLNFPIYRYCIVTVNPNFEKKGKINPKKYFKINYVGQKIKEFSKDIEKNLKIYDEVVLSQNEPKINYDFHCSGFHTCPYVEYCRKPLPNPSVFDLFACNNKMNLYLNNIISFEDILKTQTNLSLFQKRQIEYNLNSLPTYVEKENLKTYLSKFTYPLYFLDFETTQQEMPLFDGIKPFEQIPFQYSLHYILEENGELHHTEFLANENEDPKIELVKHLVNDIPTNSCIIAYNANFEKSVITNLSKKFPEYKEHLLKLTKNFIDLFDPFEKGYIYDKLMGGSFSLKSVLPALYPDEPTLNYSNLEDVHNGMDARILFPSLIYMSKEERENERENLLKYCFLDTFAMVKIWEKLKKLAE